MFILVNDNKKFSISQDYNNHRGNANIDILIPGETTISIFAGLESPSDALFRITHNNVGADVEDLKIHLTLLAGQQLATNVLWRKEMTKDIQSYVRWIVDSPQLTLIPFDIEDQRILKIMQDFSKRVVKDLTQEDIQVDCSRIRRDSKNFVHSIEENLKGRENINNQLLDYILESLRDGIDYW